MSYFGSGTTSQSILEAIEYEESLSADKGESSQDFVKGLLEAVAVVIGRKIDEFPSSEVHK